MTMTSKNLMNKPQGPALQHPSEAQKYDKQQYQLEQFLTVKKHHENKTNSNIVDTINT